MSDLTPEGRAELAEYVTEWFQTCRAMGVRLTPENVVEWLVDSSGVLPRIVAAHVARATGDAEARLAAVRAVVDRPNVVPVQTLEGVENAPVIWPLDLRAALDDPAPTTAAEQGAWVCGVCGEGNPAHREGGARSECVFEPVWKAIPAPTTDACHNGHKFIPGLSTDDPPGAPGDPSWCNTCGEARRRHAPTTDDDSGPGDLDSDLHATSLATSPGSVPAPTTDAD